MIADAFRFIVPLLLVAVLAWVLFGYYIISLIALLLAAFVGYFFRNPRRVVPENENLIVSPADGKVVRIDTDSSADGENQISIFLNLFDVHVNRAPISGSLERLEYRPGRFKAAFVDEASRVNEQNVLTIRGKDITVTIRQIAGLIARRVVCWKPQGSTMTRGETFGLIRFGSRVDVVLPKEVVLSVKLGDRVKGGSSVLGEYCNGKASRISAQSA
jgi:phosphatidylserine decarboxylase